MSQQAIQMIQQIGTLDDVVREVEKYRTKFGNDEFISSLENFSDWKFWFDKILQLLDFSYKSQSEIGVLLLQTTVQTSWLNCWQ